jgi:hypothetical protein
MWAIALVAFTAGFVTCFGLHVAGAYLQRREAAIAAPPDVLEIENASELVIAMRDAMVEAADALERHSWVPPEALIDRMRRLIEQARRVV